MELNLGTIDLSLIGAVAAISLTISLTISFTFYKYTLYIVNKEKATVIVQGNSGNVIVNQIVNQGQFDGLNIS